MKEQTTYPSISFAKTPSCPALEKHPKVVLSHGPTPLEPLGNLGRHLGIELWAKRDDCNGLAMGGNKVRQLEYYFGDAASSRADTVLVTGALQSNFVRLTAAAARKVGWHPEVQLEARVSRDDIFYKESGNVLLDRMLDAGIHHIDCGDNEQAADENLEKIATALAAAGKNPYVIHLASNHPPVGALGYVEAAVEIRNQLQLSSHEVDHVVIPSGSGLTHAGFLVGARLIGWQVSVHGICVRRDATAQHNRIALRCDQLCQLLGVASPLSEKDVIVHDSVLAPGYGQINDAVSDAIAQAARHEALFLDPVYSGRCMAGMIDLVSSGAIAPGERVAFIHTGGAPGVFAYQSDLVDLVGLTNLAAPG